MGVGALTHWAWVAQQGWRSECSQQDVYGQILQCHKSALMPLSKEIFELVEHVQDLWPCWVVLQMERMQALLKAFSLCLNF